MHGTVTSGITSSGELALSGLRILSAGSFNVVASSTGMTSASSTLLNIVNYDYTLTLASQVTSYSMNFLFTVTATLNGEDGNLFLGSCTVTLTSTETIYGSPVSTTSTGTATFSIYIATTGSKIITGTCPASGNSPAVTGSLTITIEQLQIKITSITPTVNPT